MPSPKPPLQWLWHQALTIKDLAINGYDLLDLGFAQNKSMGDCLKHLLEIVLENPEDNTKEKLIELAKTFKENIKEEK